jgi:hypothetical protein
MLCELQAENYDLHKTEKVAELLGSIVENRVVRGGFQQPEVLGDLNWFEVVYESTCFTE